MQLSRATKEISVGAFVSIGLILFAVGVMAISKEQRLFARKTKYWTRIDNTSGLAEGSPVRLVGVQIGTVAEIEFPEDIKEITASLRDLLIAINRGGGIMQEMIHNPEFGRQGVANLEGSLASLRRTLESVEKGKGLAGTLLTNEEFARKQMENIDATLTRLRSVTEKLDSDQGLVAALTAPDGKGARAVEDLRASAASLRKTAEGLQEGRGLIGR